MTTSNERRRILAWMGAAVIAPLTPTPLLAEERPATPRMTEGPFYPRRFPSDTDSDLTRIAGSTRVAEGTVLDVSGRVLDRSGRPRAGARVEIGEPGNERDGIYRSLGREAALVTLRLESAGARLKGALDVVLAA